MGEHRNDGRLSANALSDRVNSMAFDTPIAFIVFNRPDLTERVFGVIAERRPSRLLVVADGPRAGRAGEAERCRAVREIVGRVDWPCDVRTNFSEANLGCRRRVSSGIDWVFQNVDRAILLEDDCLPSASFFDYAAETLERYADDARIATVTGDNFQAVGRTYPGSYYFSRYPHIWGWATWRRAWANYDVTLAAWPAARATNWLATLLDDPDEVAYWTRAFDAVHAGEIDTWDYQWVFACWQQRALAVLPAVNLVSNLGFRADASHTTGTSAWANASAGELTDLRHPAEVVRDAAADRYTFDEVFGGRALRDARRPTRRVWRGVKRVATRAMRLLKGRP